MAYTFPNKNSLTYLHSILTRLIGSQQEFIGRKLYFTPF